MLARCMRMMWILGIVAMVASNAEFHRGTETHMVSTLAEMERIEKPVLRIRKSDTRSSNCNTWSIWLDSHTPNSSKPTEAESLSAADLDLFCPPSAHGNVTQMECKDDADNVFIGSREDVDHQYLIECDNISIGVVCTPKQANFHYCPDLAVRYFCSCALPIQIDEGGNMPINTTDNSKQDDANSEEDENVFEELSRSVLLKHSVPVYVFLLVLIIMCGVIIAMLCKKKFSSEGIPKPTTVSPL